VALTQGVALDTLSELSETLGWPTSPMLATEAPTQSEPSSLSPSELSEVRSLLALCESFDLEAQQLADSLKPSLMRLLGEEFNALEGELMSFELSACAERLRDALASHRSGEGEPH
jgi:hypothetical protein